jgi:hypothetical protein
MRKDGRKTPKGSRAKKAAVRDLTVKDAKAVKGGDAGSPAPDKARPQVIGDHGGSGSITDTGGEVIGQNSKPDTGGGYGKQEA